MGYYDDKNVEVFKGIAQEAVDYNLNLMKKLEKDLSLDLSDITRSALLQKLEECKSKHADGQKELASWNRLSKEGVKYVDCDYTPSQLQL